MDKAAIFIDGGYLGKVLKKYFAEPRIDFLTLSSEICAEIQVSRLRTYFYDCMPLKREGNQHDTIMYAEKQRFIANIERLPRFEVKKGRLQLIGTQFKQKMVDVLMSIDIVEKCCEKQIQHAILVAGDSDFVPAVKKAKDYGAIVHLYYHPAAVRDDLVNEIDELHLITPELIDKVKL